MKRFLLFVSCFVFSASLAVADPLPIEPLPADHDYETPTLLSTAEALVQTVDDEGTIVETLMPFDSVNILPGMTIVYTFTLVNPLDTTLDNIVLRNPFPTTMQLLATTIAGPEGMTGSYSVPVETTPPPETPVFYPIYPMPDADTLENQPSVEDLDVLQFSLPDVPAQSQVRFVYTGVVRS